MDKVNNQFLSSSSGENRRIVRLGLPHLDSDVFISDRRVARLLVVLEDLDRFVAGLEELSQKELSDLVSSAIVACGFVDPVEANYAIASVLKAIESPGPFANC